MFHHFHEGDGPAGVGSINARTLARMLDHLGPSRILPAAEWCSRAIRGALRPGELCLTFDDNLRCQFDVALPVLRDYRLTGFWFVATAVLQGHLSRTEVYRAFRTRYFEGGSGFYEEFLRFVDRSAEGPRVRAALEAFDPSGYLGEYAFYSDDDRRFRFVRDDVLGVEAYQRLMDEMIRARGLKLKDLGAGLWMNDDCLRQLAAEGHVIGLHSHTHPTRLAELPPPLQRREYRANHAYLTSLLGTPPSSVSHPCNSYDEQTLRILRGMGVRIGFRSNATLATHSELEYPREDHVHVLATMS